jgi:hypothetical protein
VDHTPAKIERDHSIGRRFQQFLEHETELLAPFEEAPQRVEFLRIALRSGAGPSP